ncbi:MAG: AAA family ATPase, partial [Desulfobacterales bacterium]|nr:AAA family ATPase [Desulfobacterales bacterium]
MERLRLENRDPLEKIALTGWPIPALYLRGKPLPLYDPGEAYEKTEPPAELPLDGVCVRKVGDFVGRRMDQRVLSRELRGDRRAGVVIHGMGGVGKSSLAAQVLHRLHLEGRFLVSLTGEVSVHDILETLGQRLLGLCYAQGFDETHPTRQIANDLKQQNLEWETRFGIFHQNILAQMELVLLLDNFEDNLNRERAVKDEILGELLARWAKNPGKSRLVFTSRYPFSLPDGAEAHLKLHHLGPLSLSETRKLVWNLPGLNALKKEGLVKAYASVGGHPRALEYLDAILRGGEARFTDVT